MKLNRNELNSVTEFEKTDQWKHGAPLHRGIPSEFLLLMSVHSKLQRDIYNL